VARLEDLITDRKAGKAVVTVNDGATVLRPQRVIDIDADRIAVATTRGKLLLFGATELPLLAIGKGVQTIKLHKTELFPEKVIGLAVVGTDGTLAVHAGKRHATIKGTDLDVYFGKRAHRGLKLPRGLQNVSAIRASADRDGTGRES
jgi:topoisomerase IV subunit A